MKTRFKSEKQAREETIGRARTMAEVAVREAREFTDRESRKVDALLKTAELVELGKAIPRTARELLAWLDKPTPRRKPAA